MNTRRELLLKGSAALSGFALGLPLIANPARAADKVTMLTANGFQPDFIELMNGYSGKHFAKQGIDAEILGPHGTSQAGQLLMAGKAQFARFSGLDLVKVVGKANAPFVSISTMSQASTFHIVSTAEKPINKAEDLKGKKIGIVSIGGSTDTYVEMILRKVGIPSDSVEKRAVGNSLAAYQFVKRGVIDCCVLSLPVVMAVQSLNEKIVSWNTDRYVPMPGQCYLTTKDIIKENPDLVVRFLRGLRGSVEELMSNPAQPLFKRAAKDFEIPNLENIDFQAHILKEVINQQWLSEGRENLMRNVPKLWHDAAETAHILGADSFGDGSSVYTNKYVDAAMKS